MKGQLNVLFHMDLSVFSVTSHLLIPLSSDSLDLSFTVPHHNLRSERLNNE